MLNCSAHIYALLGLSGLHMLKGFPRFTRDITFLSELKSRYNWRWYLGEPNWSYILLHKNCLPTGLPLQCLFNVRLWRKRWHWEIWAVKRMGQVVILCTSLISWINIYPSTSNHMVCSTRSFGNYEDPHCTTKVHHKCGFLNSICDLKISLYETFICQKSWHQKWWRNST